METGKPTDTPDTIQPQTNVVPLPPKDEPVAAHQKAARFVREHPVLTIAGGLAVGAVAAALIPRKNRRYVARQGSMIADAIAAASASVAHQALGSLETASSGVRRGARAVASRAEHAGEAVVERANALVGRKPLPPTLGERIAARAGEIAGRLRG